MITATFLEYGKTDDGLLWFSVLYSDGTNKPVQKVYRGYRSLDSATVTATARHDAKLIELAATESGKVSFSKGDIIDISEPVSAPADPKLEAFNTAYQKLAQLKRGFDVGLISQSALDKAIQTALEAYLPEYEDYL